MKTVLKRIIADFHRSPLPEFRRRALDVPSNLAKIVVIVGPRRAGKTYYLHQLMSDLEKEGIPRKRMVHLNFEAGAERPHGGKADTGRVRWAGSCRERGARTGYCFMDPGHGASGMADRGGAATETFPPPAPGVRLPAERNHGPRSA